MLRAIQEFFDNRIRPDAAGISAAQDQEHTLQLATAALLVEMTRADFTVQDAERAAVLDAVQTLFDLPDEETRELVALAEMEASESSSLFQFTHLIDKNFPIEEKRRIVEMLWRVAFADSEKDKHEEHMVRKIADLLHVRHSDFIRARIRVEEDWLK
jgi:uncharacterized tellurite resistance protein B-like protein